MSIHGIGAALLDTPELELDRIEAEKLSEAAQKVAALYAVSVDPRKMAIVNLVVVAGGIYGTRFLAWRTRMKKEEGRARLQVLENREPERQPAQPMPPKAEPTNPSDIWPQNGVITGPIA